MTSTLKTLAIAGLMGTLSAPAFAAAHMSSEMSCEDYNQLSGSDRDKVAMMAITSMNTDAEVGDGTAKATTTLEGSVAGEGEPDGSLEGSATATSVEGADSDMSQYAENLALLNRVCSRNWDATVQEAASGQFGSR